MSKGTDQTTVFQHLVLNGIWMLFLAIRGRTHREQSLNWRNGAIRFGDDYDLPGDDAKRVRRDVTYRLPPNT